MKVAIEVKDRAEGDRIKTALTDEVTRAALNAMGALLPLSPRAQKNVLRFVSDQLDPFEPTTEQ